MIEKAGRIRIVGETQVKGFHDTKAKFDALLGIVKKVGEGFDSFLAHGTRVSHMLAAQKFPVDQAQQATGGLVTKLKLLEAANRGVALGVDLNAERFATLSRAAAVVARKMGTDVNQAIGDLMLGMGRQSRLILDNLGIIVNAESAYTEYAAAIGTTAAKLTDAQKRVAFQSAAMKELNRIAGDTTLTTGEAGSAWQKFKNEMSDSYDTIARATSQSKTLGKVVGELVKPFQWVARNVRFLIGEMDAFSKEGVQTMLTSLKVMDTLTGGATKLSAAVKPLEKLWGQMTGDEGERFGRLEADWGVGKGLWAGSQNIALRKEEAKKKGKGKGRGRRIRTGDDAEHVKEFRYHERATRGAEAIDRQIRAQNQLAEAERKRTERLYELVRAERAANDNAEQFARQSVEQAERIGEVGLAVGQFAAGLWSAADAAIQSGASFGTAVAQMIKGVMLGIAQEATVRALLHLAYAWGGIGSYGMTGNPAAHFKAAALFGVVAGIAGSAGLAISAATASGGAAAAAKPTNNAPQFAERRSSFGVRKREEERPLVVEVYLGDGNRAAALMARKQITAQLRTAA